MTLSRPSSSGIAAPVEQLMQCMEVWGGNQAVNSHVVMAGLDAWVYAKPFGSSASGGDVYYASSCATDRILRLLIADVSGHGDAVRGVAVGLRDLMRRYVNHLDHVHFIRSMNRKFAELAEAGTFATAIVTTYFGPTGRLTLCNAGHPPPLVYRAAARQWQYLEQPAAAAESDEPTNLPLGIVDLADYVTSDTPLDAGDMVLCYTDSLVEARDAAGEMLGQAGLLDAARGIDPSNPSALIPSLLVALAVERRLDLAADDVTLLLFRPNGRGRRRVLLRHQFLAAGRILRTIPRAFKSGGPPVPWPDLTLANVGGAIFSPLCRLWHTKRGKSFEEQ